MSKDLNNISFMRNGKEFEPTKRELKIVVEDLSIKIADLEAKLAESEKKREYLFSSNCDYVSQIEELKQQLAEQKRVSDWLDNVLKKYAKQEELLSQKLKSLGIDCIEDLSKYQHQNKISFCIERLEKVREKIQEDRESLINYNNTSEVLMADGFLCDCKNFIDNQIKQLKEMK